MKIDNEIRLVAIVKYLAKQGIDFPINPVSFKRKKWLRAIVVELDPVLLDGAFSRCGGEHCEIKYSLSGVWMAQSVPDMCSLWIQVPIRANSKIGYLSRLNFYFNMHRNMNAIAQVHRPDGPDGLIAVWNKYDELVDRQKLDLGDLDNILDI